MHIWAEVSGASSGELKKARNFIISARILRAVGLRRHG